MTMNLNSITEINPTMIDGLMRAAGSKHCEGIKDVVLEQAILDILSDGKKRRCLELTLEIEERLGIEHGYLTWQKISAILRKLHIYAMLVKREEFKTGNVIIVGTRVSDGSLVEIEEEIALFSLA